MNINLPIPLEDEVALGFLGRFAHLNGMSSFKWIIQSLKASGSREKPEPLLWLLAKACGLNPVEFAAAHSMLPVLYPISGYVGSRREVGNARHLAMSSGLCAPTGGLRWCPHCLTQDMEARGLGYWRRRHQINGIDWCIDHHVSLVSSTSNSVVGLMADDSAQSQLVAPAIVKLERHSTALLRLQQVLLAWLRHRQPISLQAWTSVVSRRCRQLGLRVGEVGKRQVASDLIREQFPLSWLVRHMPEVADKVPGTYVRKVDGACADKHVAYPALACAVLLTVLFESTDDAMSELLSANEQFAIKPAPRQATTDAVFAFLAGTSLRDACNKFGANLLNVEDELRRGYSEKSVVMDA
jgi:hypothetical protein